MDQYAEEKSCPYCAETIKAAAVKCRYCNTALSANKKTGESSSFITNQTVSPKVYLPSPVTIMAVSLTGIIVFAIFSYLSPYWAIQQLKEAIRNRDVVTINHLVDFSCLKDCIKTRLLDEAAKKFKDDPSQAQNPWATLGFMVGTSMVNNVVDTIVSPAGLANLIQGNLPGNTIPGHNETKNSSLTSYNSGYRGFNKFVLIVTNNRTDGSNEETFSLGRVDLFSWKLNDISWKFVASPATCDQVTRSNMRAAQIAVEMYAVDHDGTYPANFESCRCYLPGGNSSDNIAGSALLNLCTEKKAYPTRSNFSANYIAGRPANLFQVSPGEIQYLPIVEDGRINNYAIIGGDYSGKALSTIDGKILILSRSEDPRSPSGVETDSDDSAQDVESSETKYESYNPSKTGDLKLELKHVNARITQAFNKKDLKSAVPLYKRAVEIIKELGDVPALREAENHYQNLLNRVSDFEQSQHTMAKDHLSPSPMAMPSATPEYIAQKPRNLPEKPFPAPSGLPSSCAPSVESLKEIDFGPYMADLQRRIKRAWFPPRGQESKRVEVKFDVHNDGTITNLRLSKPSGVLTADNAAMEAVKNACPFRSLPLGSPSAVAIRFTFDYNVFGGMSKFRQF